MSNSLIIEGKEYIPATLAGKEFDYTKDYLLLLIRQGKIDGKKISNRWYVHLPSARQFFAGAKKSHVERSEKIRTERKIELKEHGYEVKSRSSRNALMETSAILMIGLVLGATGYFGSSVAREAVVQGDSDVLRHTAISFYSFFNSKKSFVAEVSSGSESLNDEGAQDGSKNTSDNSMIVTPESQFDPSRVQSIRDSFSDEVGVAIDPENPDTGIIIPKFKDREGEAYRFLMVPVTTQEGS